MTSKNIRVGRRVAIAARGLATKGCGLSTLGCGPATVTCGLTTSTKFQNILSNVEKVVNN